MQMTQMKQKRFWLDQSIFNWMKLKSKKRNKYRKRNSSENFLIEHFNLKTFFLFLKKIKNNLIRCSVFLCFFP
jgi:hypothetical protein